MCFYRKNYFCILRYIKQANKAPNGEGYTQGRTPKEKNKTASVHKLSAAK